MDPVMCTVSLPLIGSIPATIVMKINEIWFTMAQEKGLLAHYKLGKYIFFRVSFEILSSEVNYLWL